RQLSHSRHTTERWRRNMPSSLSSLRYPTTPSLPIGPSHPLSWCSLSIRWRRGADNGKHMRCHFAFVITGRVMRAGRFRECMTHTHTHTHIHTHTHTHTQTVKVELPYTHPTHSLSPDALSRSRVHAASVR